MKSKIAYLKSLPKKRLAAGLLLFDVDNRLLVLKPSYRDGWTIPGGVVNEYESPLAAVIRESKEEIGIKVCVLKCLALDYTKNTIDEYISESLQIIFLGQKLSTDDVQSIKIDGREIVDYRLVEYHEALTMLDSKLATRLNATNHITQEFIFLENGVPITV